VESGWDLNLGDIDMFECENGHTVCRKHLSETYRDKFEEDDFDIGDVDPEMCPVCKFESLPDSELLQYLLKGIAGMTKETVLSRIRNSFSSYKEFSDFIYKKGKEI
jgi:hypothetical protein